MTISVVEHGDWIPYIREPRRDVNGALLEPTGVMYCKRVSDDADWYVTVQGTEFANVVVLATALKQSDTTFALNVVVTEHQRLFPQNHRLLEIVGYDGTDPQADLGGMIYDATAKTLTAPPPPPAPPQRTDKADIWRRVSDAEAETIVAVLGQQTTRKQRLFNDAQYIDHSDELYAELLAGFVQQFGADRAAVILAPSS